VAVVVALGTDCLADVSTLRCEPAVFGLVASDATGSRLIEVRASGNLTVPQHHPRPSGCESLTQDRVSIAIDSTGAITLAAGPTHGVIGWT
jgi:hypothetical protein